MNQIKTKKDLEKALGQSRQTKVSDLKKDTYGILILKNRFARSHSEIEARGFLKIDNDFVQKTESGLYIIHGLNFRYFLDENCIPHEEIDLHHKLCKSGSFFNRVNYSRSVEGARMVSNMKNNLLNQIEYAKFYANNLRDQDSVKAQIFYPTDEVIALYE